jgi:hypothetical protein
MDDLPEGIPAAAFAEQEDGSFLLRVSPVDGWRLDEVDKLKRELAKAVQANERATKRMKQFEGEDGQLVDIAQLRAQIEEMENLRSSATPNEKAKAALDAAVEKVRVEYEAQLKQSSERVTNLERDISELVVDAVGAAACAKHKADADLLMPHIRASSVVERNGDSKPSAFVVDRDGDKVFSEQAGPDRTYMQIDELVAGPLRKRFPRAYEGEQLSGTGSHPSQGGGGVAHTMTRAEARNPEVYRVKKAAAEKAGVELQLSD